VRSCKRMIFRASNRRNRLCLTQRSWLRSFARRVGVVGLVCSPSSADRNVSRSRVVVSSFSCDESRDLSCYCSNCCLNCCCRCFFLLCLFLSLDDMSLRRKVSSHFELARAFVNILVLLFSGAIVERSCPFSNE
jgi:hypothetical protein